MGVFERDGAQHFAAVLDESAVARLRLLADERLTEGPGARLAVLPDDLEPVHTLARRLIGCDARPVRAVVFDKREEANWAVAWHQDRTIVVRERIEVEGFGPWSTKQALLHVAPPIEVLEGMATLRVHLDDCGEANAPLLAALSSHKLGRVPASEAAALASACEVLTCLATAGDVWAYSTPVLHASERAAEPARRRVIQLDYAATELPAGLRWLGLA